MNELKTVRYDVQGTVARVVMNRPEVRNAQSLGLLQDLDAAFTAACDDPSVRVIILSGEGPAFSAGHDLGTPEHLAQLKEHYSSELTEIERSYAHSFDYFLDLSLRWRDLPKPTIAQVHGWCLFGGWIIASSMDLITASADARFGTSFLQYFPLPYDVGARRAKRLLFDPHLISADEAEELGFVTLVAEPDQLEAETLALAERITKRPAFWLRLAKRSINDAEEAGGFRASAMAAHAHHALYVAHEREADRRAAGLNPTPPLPATRKRPIMDQLLQGDQSAADRR